MNELVRQNRPRKWVRRVTLIGAALLGVALAGGGIALAAGYDPIHLFVTFDADGNGVVLDANGNPTDVHATFVPTGDGHIEVTGTIQQPGTYEIVVVPPGDGAGRK